MLLYRYGRTKHHAVSNTLIEYVDPYIVCEWADKAGLRLSVTKSGEDGDRWEVYAQGTEEQVQYYGRLEDAWLSGRDDDTRECRVGTPDGIKSTDQFSEDGE